MEWTDDGIVLGTRRHGEANAIAEIMTVGHGRHLGLVRGGAGSRLRPVLQPGNSVRVVWRARLDEHLGHYAVEPLRLHGAGVAAFRPSPRLGEHTAEVLAKMLGLDPSEIAKLKADGNPLYK